ncbi:MAG: hypothetical protein ACP5U2_04820 [Bryobacteraceae bacterium]
MWPAVWLGVLLAGALAPELVHGVLVDLEGDVNSGQISVRAADFHVHVALYDSQTAIWREGRPVGAVALRQGDSLEVTCAGTSEPRCWARRIEVLAPAAARPPDPLPGWGRWDWASSPFPRGQLLLAGVITELAPQQVRLRTRDGRSRLLRLREDTRLLADGLPVGPAALRVNLHVFVRAGRGLEGELEAYQIVWGSILPTR